MTPEEYELRLGPLEKACLQKQIEELTDNCKPEDLKNEDFLRGMNRILCGACGFWVGNQYPHPLKGLMLFAWLKYTLLATAKLMEDQNFDLTYVMNGKESDMEDAFKFMDELFDTKVTLAEESDGERETAGGS